LLREEQKKRDLTNGCWGEYLCVRDRNKQDGSENFIIRNFVLCMLTFHHIKLSLG
jgi:hypothetical protein